MVRAADLDATAEAQGELPVPDDLPFLERISWFDRDYRDLSPLDMLRRYESGWRHLGVLGEPSSEEWRFIRRLVQRFGSTLDLQGNGGHQDIEPDSLGREIDIGFEQAKAGDLVDGEEVFEDLQGRSSGRSRSRS